MVCKYCGKEHDRLGTGLSYEDMQKHNKAVDEEYEQMRNESRLRELGKKLREQ
jgi:hypothetical protein